MRVDVLAMVVKHKQLTRRAERHADQRRTNSQRRELQQRLERYDARPLLPEPEPPGVYRP